MTFLNILILAVIQGLAELLPVSSWHTLLWRKKYWG
jgi:undecaprenyl pyrophosphate phosphatase UppP